MKLAFGFVCAMAAAILGVSGAAAQPGTSSTVVVPFEFDSQDGTPTDGMEVTFSWPGRTPQTKTTDSDGRVSFTAPSSSVGSNLRGTLSFPTPLHAEFPGTADTEITFRVIANAAKLTLQAADGDPDDYDVVYDSGDILTHSATAVEVED